MTERRPSTHDDALNRVWNELVRPTGDPDAAGDALDPATADAVRRLQTLGAAPPPASSRERVRRAVRADVAAQFVADDAPPVDPMGWYDLPGAFAGPNGHAGAQPAVGPRPGLAPESRRWGFAHLATAALLVLVLGLGYLTIARGSGDRPSRETIPAAIGDAVLLDVGLPAEIFPHGAGREVGLVTATVPPGPPVAWAGSATETGLRIDFVLAGRYAVWTEGPARLVRAGGQPQEVLAGSEVELGPGDAWIARTETAFTYTNPGVEPAWLLVWTMTERTTIAAPLPPGWDWPHDYPSQRVTAPEGPTRLVLRRVEVAAGGAVPAPAAGGFQIGDALPTDAAGTTVSASLGIQGDGAIRNLGREPVTLHVVSLEPESLPDLSGERQTFGEEG